MLRASRLFLGSFASKQHLSDPWPLPNSPAHIAATVSKPGAPPIPPIQRVNESLEKMRARLVYQTRKRGTLESDLLLSTFAHEFLHSMTLAQLKEFDLLLDENDWDIYYWATNKRDPPSRWADTELLQQLRLHAQNQGKQVRRMPDL
ncbi:DUF339-domain-containing protein [Sistotremastrum niveocremeum HHB9708]|uniref:Succinate dehydrogenase assembly factor 2, mitochondrial n=1 Tax=Sistotremastrum niveocremeum HHB9708 TaxID=1314777 RepID=A0A164N0M9_9AGAM|nr:DUF339-domain-containing protein [Sistotremastrum niveocremeum HHB9708]